MRLDLRKYHEKLAMLDPIRNLGVVKKAVGLIIESTGPYASVGTMCEVLKPSRQGQNPLVEIVGFRDQTVLSMALEDISNIQMGDYLVARQQSTHLPVGLHLLGRVIDGLGHPLDGRPLENSSILYPLQRTGQNPLERENITDMLTTGIRSIDLFLTCGKGQRIGIFGGSGVGKSTLIGMMARYTAADVNVIAMIGERGREVRAFLESDLGPEGLKKSVVVVSTSDTSPLVRIRGTYMAAAIAEFFRDEGLDVLFIMDSATRVAMAQREIGLATGEPPSARGYTPSVFAMMPKFVERAGNFKGKGSITGYYTVLVEGDDMSDPIADTLRSLLDGHIVLSRDLAWKNHYPAISILDSISRVMPQIVSAGHLRLAGKFRNLLSTYSQAEDLINIGAYKKGNNPNIDRAMDKIEGMTGLLQQDAGSSVSFSDGLQSLTGLLRDVS